MEPFNATLAPLMLLTPKFWHSVAGEIIIARMKGRLGRIGVLEREELLLGEGVGKCRVLQVWVIGAQDIWWLCRCFAAWKGLGDEEGCFGGDIARDFVRVEGAAGVARDAGRGIPITERAGEFTRRNDGNDHARMVFAADYAWKQNVSMLKWLLTRACSKTECWYVRVVIATDDAREENGGMSARSLIWVMLRDMLKWSLLREIFENRMEGR